MRADPGLRSGNAAEHTNMPPSAAVTSMELIKSATPQFTSPVSGPEIQGNAVTIRLEAVSTIGNSYGGPTTRPVLTAWLSPASDTAVT